MAQYRILTQQELLSLEKEFVEFLVVNGITAPDWEQMKTDNPAKANKLLDLFSDVVFEGIFRKVQYLDFRSPDKLMSFQCLAEKMVLVCMESTAGGDLMDSAFYAQAMTGKVEGLKVFTTEKPYSKKRELELFEMTEQGCEISKSGKLFKTICLAL